MKKKNMLMFLSLLLTITLITTGCGKEIDIKLFKPIEKQKELTGTLQEFDKDKLTITTEDAQETTIERSNISSMKRAFKW